MSYEIATGLPSAQNITGMTIHQGFRSATNYLKNYFGASMLLNYLVLSNIRKIILLSLLFVCFINYSSAQSLSTKQNKTETDIIIYCSIPYSLFDKQKMEPQGVGDGLGWFSLGFDTFFYDLLLLGAEIGWDSPNDKKEFTNMTSSGELTSSVSVWQFSLLTGLKSPYIKFSSNSKSYLFGNINVGNMWAFFEERSIQNCIGCDEDKIDISGGFFIKPELYYVFDVFSIGLSYRHFLNSDYKAKIELKLSAILTKTAK